MRRDGKLPKRNRQKSLKEKIRGMFLILTAFYMVLILVTGFVLVSKSSTQFLTENGRTMAESMGDNLDSIFQNISNMTLLIMNDTEVIHFLRSGNPQDATKAVSNVKKLSATFPNVYSIFLIAEDGRYISTGRDITKLNQKAYDSGVWKRELDKRKGMYAVYLNGADIFSMNTGQEILSLMRRVYDSETQLPVGYMVVNLPASVLDMAYEKAAEGRQKLYFSDLNRTVRGSGGYQKEFCALMGTDTAYTQKIERGLDKIRVFTAIKCAADSFYIGTVNETTILYLLKEQVNILWILFIAITVFGFVGIGTFINRAVTKPIEELCRSMEDVKGGYFHRVSLKLPNDEIGILKNTYNNMLVETNRLIENLVEQEKRAQSAQLKVLQEQIKPHFLYNTLDTICYMVLEKPREEVYDALETLGSFYRKFLSKGKSEIPLSDEIRIIKDYLTLQKLRYEHVFEDEYDLIEDARMEAIMVPKLILQPLVENSIYHGIRPKGEPGTIRISVEDAEDDTNDVIITVWDNGVGMTAEEMKECLCQDNGKSFGFKGTMERLKHFCRKDSVYTVRSKKGRYFEVKLYIPKRRWRNG